MDKNFCTQCGAPAGSPSYTPNGGLNQSQTNQIYVSQPTNGLAIAGFVLSMIGCGFPLGLILSAIALGQFNKNPNQKGKGLAIAGLAVSVASIFIFILFFGISSAFYGY